MHLLKLGTVKQGRFRVEETTGESLGRAAVAHWDITANGALETGSES